MAIPLIIDSKVLSEIAALRQRAEAAPVNMPVLVRAIETPEGKARHMRQMTAQSIAIPFGYLVTYSVEEGHPCGTCRHMSMSVNAEGRVPNEFAVWMIAKEFGFHGGLAVCSVWTEKLQGHGVAINVVQPFESQ